MSTKTDILLPRISSTRPSFRKAREKLQNGGRSLPLMQIARGKKPDTSKKLEELIVFHRRRQLLSAAGVFVQIPAIE